MSGNNVKKKTVDMIPDPVDVYMSVIGSLEEKYRFELPVPRGSHWVYDSSCSYVKDYRLGKIEVRDDQDEIIYRTKIKGADVELESHGASVGEGSVTICGPKKCVKYTLPMIERERVGDRIQHLSLENVPKKLAPYLEGVVQEMQKEIERRYMGLYNRRRVKRVKIRELKPKPKAPSVIWYFR